MLKDTDFILNPAVNDIDITNMESKDENIIQGRLETRKNIELIKDMIIKKVFNKNKI
jgi:hypothetical protein